MKLKYVFVSACFATVLTSCAVAPSQLGQSLISDTKEPILVTTNSGDAKEGKACGRNILGIFSEGDMSIEAAKNNGKITNVHSVEKTVKNMIVVSDVCTIVKGN